MRGDTEKRERVGYGPGSLVHCPCCVWPDRDLERLQRKKAKRRAIREAMEDV